MIVVFPFSLTDQDQALRCARWIRELDGVDGFGRHKVLLVKDHRVGSFISQQILEELALVFGSTETLNITTDAWDKWPESCNHMFAKAARHIERQPDHGPFLWLEADAIPLKKGWLDTLEAEYKQGGKPFMGDLVNVPNVPIHMSGVGIYPAVVGEHAKEALIAHEIAWDVQAADDIVPQMHETKLIEHAWLHPNFADWDSVVREVDLANAVLFHSSKDGSLIERLRERGGQTASHLAHNQGTAGSTPAPATNLPVPVLAEADVRRPEIEQQSEARESTNPVIERDSRGGQNQFYIPARIPTEGDSVMGRAPDVLSGAVDDSMARSAARSQTVCDIFIKTYPPDYQWLRYCLKSIDKFADEFRQTIITYPGGDIFPFGRGMKHNPKMVQVGDQPDGYLWQQVIKLDADKYTDSPFILYIDSDTIFTTPVTPKNYIRDGKVLWMMTPYEKVSTPWQPIVEKFLKKPVAFEFMRRFPMMVPRWLLAELRAFCEREHGVPIDSYILSQPHRAFSEFNALGAFAHEFFRDEFIWVNTEETPPEDWPILTVMQCWSKGGLTAEIKQKFEEILSAAPVLAEPLQASDVEPGNTTHTRSGEAREEHQRTTPDTYATGDSRGGGQTLSVDDAIAVLAREAERGWFYKKRLEKKLKEAGALPKWSRPRRATDKKWKGK